MRYPTPAEWLILLEEFQGSELQQKEFAAKQDISLGTFRYWLYRRTKHVQLEEVVGLGVDKVQRHFQKVTATLDAWHDHTLPDANAKAVIYDAFVAGELDVSKRLAPEVHRLYFEPEHDEFRPRTFYSLSNAFTSAFKSLEPVRLMEATAKLAPFLAQYPLSHTTL